MHYDYSNGLDTPSREREVVVPPEQGMSRTMALRYRYADCAVVIPGNSYYAEVNPNDAVIHFIGERPRYLDDYALSDILTMLVRDRAYGELFDKGYPDKLQAIMDRYHVPPYTPPSFVQRSMPRYEPMYQTRTHGDIVRHIYGRNIHLTLDDHNHLMILADMCGVSTLSQRAMDALRDKIAYDRSLGINIETEEYANRTERAIELRKSSR